MKHTAVLFLFFVFGTAAYAQRSPFEKNLPQVDAYVDSLMKTWNIPGLALAIVYKDQLIYEKGYGYRDREAQLPVTAATIFPIASNTKLFTATTACILQEEGLLSLDKPARSFLPTLQFSNEELNARVTLRDMLSHRTGLPRYDGIWAGSSFTRKEMVARIAYMQPQLGFREGYIYNNMMYVGAGAVMEQVTGSSWEALIRSRLLQPLQMNATGFAQEEMTRSGNYAVAYYEDSTHQLRRLAYAAQCDALGPAGTMKSNLEDMSHWMIVQLNGGKYKGVQAVSANAISQTLIPNTIADKTARWEELTNPLYALGRNIQAYKGYKIATHTGSIDGFYSNLTFVPAAGIGIFMVHNSAPAGSLRSIMAFPVIDRLLGLSLTNWSGRFRQDYLTSQALEKRQKDSVLATRVKNSSPSHPLEAYAGTYSSPVYGTVQISLEKQQLVFRYRNQTAALLHFHYDQFYTDEEEKGMPDFRLSFATGNNGTVNRFTMSPFGDAPADFVRVN